MHVQGSGQVISSRQTETKLELTTTKNVFPCRTICLFSILTLHFQVSQWKVDSSTFLTTLDFAALKSTEKEKTNGRTLQKTEIAPWRSAGIGASSAWGATNIQHRSNASCFYPENESMDSCRKKSDNHLRLLLGLTRLPSKVQEKFTLRPVFLPDSLSRRHLDNNHNWLSAWINLQILIESQRSGFLCWPSTVRSQFGKVCHCYLGRGAIFRLRRCLSGRGKDGSAP